MKFFLVDVKSITPSKPVEQFDKAEVEKLADSILECNGLLKPLVLKPTGPESYVVIQGNMEFHAAVKAREKDPRKGEMVNAFVISPKAEETVLKQIQHLQGAATPPPEYLIQHEELSLKEESSPKKDTEPVCRKEDGLSSQLLEQVQAQVKNINLKIEALASSLPSQILRMMQQLQLFERDFNESFNALKQKTVNLENIFDQKFKQQTAAFQELSDLIVKKVVVPPPKPISPEDEQAFLDFLNNKEKSELVKVKIGIGEKKAETIIRNRPYDSLEKLNNIKGFGQKTTENWLKSFREKKL